MAKKKNNVLEELNNVLPTQEQELKTLGNVEIQVGKDTSHLIGALPKRITKNNTPKTNIEFTGMQSSDLALNLEKCPLIPSRLTTDGINIILMGIESLYQTNLHAVGFEENNIIPTNLNFKIPIKTYIDLLDMENLKEQEKETVEEMKAEHTRFLNAKKTLMKKLRRVPKMLEKATIYWDTKNSVGFENFLGRLAVEKDHIEIEFTQSTAIRLLTGNEIKFSKKVYRLEDAGAKTLYIKLVSNYQLKKKQGKRYPSIISVKDIIDPAGVLSLEEVKAKKLGFEERIREPLEKKLYILEEQGLIINKGYVKEHKEELTERESDFKSYEEWVKALLHYEVIEE